MPDSAVVVNRKPAITWVYSPAVEETLDARFYHPEFLEIDVRLSSAQARGLRIRDLGMIASVQYGFMPTEDYVTESTGVPLIRVTNFTDTLSLDMSDIKYVRADQKAQRSKSVRAGDILMVQCGNTSGKISRVGENESGFLFASFCFRIRGNLDNDSDYLAVALMSDLGQTQLRRTMNYTTVRPNTTKPATQKVRIPLPQRSVQEYIGAKVRLAERCRTRAREACQTGEQLLGDYLQLPPTGDSATLNWWIDPAKHTFDKLTPRNYLPSFLAVESELITRRARPLGDLIRRSDGISNGATPRGADYPDHGIPFLRVQNIRPNFVDVSNVVHIAREIDEELGRSRIKPYDVILTITGYPGTAAVAIPELLPLNINQHSVRLGLKPGVNPFYVAAFLNSDYGYAQVQQKSAGATRDALNYSAVRSIKVPLLPSDRQDQVGQYFETYSRLLCHSQRLVRESKADIDALIEGRLDVEGIVAGRIKPPTWEDIAV